MNALSNTIWRLQDKEYLPCALKCISRIEIDLMKIQGNYI
jgi:hypothetical protein